MKKLLILSALFLICFTAFAQNDSKAAVGLGVEWNMNSEKNFGGSAVLAFDYNIGSSFAVGLNVTAGTNFSGLFVLEPAAMFRWYFLSKQHNGLFVQADAGAYLVFEKDEEYPVTFLGGLRGGIRLPLGKKFFVEPYGRVGYPFMFGVGAIAGVRF